MVWATRRLVCVKGCSRISVLVATNSPLLVIPSISVEEGKKSLFFSGWRQKLQFCSIWQISAAWPRDLFISYVNMSGIIEYLSFCGWLISLHRMSTRFIVCLFVFVFQSLEGKERSFTICPNSLPTYDFANNFYQPILMQVSSWHLAGFNAHLFLPNYLERSN